MQITRGVWQMSLAMIISGSIGAFVLLSGLPVIDVVFWRCLIGALTLLLFPFSRLVHIWSAPVEYLTRKYQIVRARR